MLDAMFRELLLFSVLCLLLANSQDSPQGGDNGGGGGGGCGDPNGCGSGTPNATNQTATPAPESASTPPPAAGLVVPYCPSGVKALKDQFNRPITCLPHHTDRCGGAGSCCYYNKIDYYCCPGVNPTDCPNYADSTVIIYKHNDFSPNIYPPAPQYYPPNIYDSIFGRPPGPKPGFFDGSYGLRGPYPQYPGQMAAPLPYQPGQPAYRVGRSVLKGLGEPSAVGIAYGLAGRADYYRFVRRNRR